MRPGHSSRIPRACRSLSLAAVLALGLLLAACDDGQTTTGEGAPAPESAEAGDSAGGAQPTGAPRFFFTQTASGGSLEGGTLTLEGVSPSVLAVAERPVRAVQRLDTADFTGGFSDTFGADDPSATLTTEAGGRVRSEGLVIGEPTYDEGASTLTYAVAVDDAESVPTSFELATLTIDAAPIKPASPVEIEISATGGQPLKRSIQAPENRALAISRDANGGLSVSESARELGGSTLFVNDSGRSLEVRATPQGGQTATYRLGSNDRLTIRF